MLRVIAFGGMALLVVAIVLGGLNGSLEMHAFCGKDQDGAVCTQQWLASLGPTIALLFAGYGAALLRLQIKQGQSGVIASEREQLRSEYEVLTDLRDEVLEKQRNLETLSRNYKSATTLPNSTSWDSLEKSQFSFDGFVEWLGDVMREPYLFQSRIQLEHIRGRAFRRSETYRSRAAAWSHDASSEAKMARCVCLTHSATVESMIDARVLIDGIIEDVARRLAFIAPSSGSDR